MATAATTSEPKCFICTKDKDKDNLYTCEGCSEKVCVADLSKHHQEHVLELEKIVIDCDIFQQNISEQKQDLNHCPLIKQVNEWERDSIMKSKQTAEDCRQRLLKSTDNNIVEMQKTLNQFITNLRRMRDGDDFKGNSFKQIEVTKPAFIPLRSCSIDIYPNARWKKNGLTVAGGNGQGNGINQLSNPLGLYIDDDQTVYVADANNHRIVEWKLGAMSGQVIDGGNEEGSWAHQLSKPTDVIFDKERDSLIICDSLNKRVVRWPRRNGTSRKTIIFDIYCRGLTMDENGSLYVVDYGKHEVRRYQKRESQGTVVAGGNRRGNRLDQLSDPQYVCVDRDHSVHVSEWGNHRVMKWMKGAKEGIVVAGGQGEGNGLTQLSYPGGVVVDQLGTVYVADDGNNRIMRWPKGATQGSVIVGGNGRGKQSNQLNQPIGLSFDRHGNLYVVDYGYGNHRVQKFNIEFNG
ncbi:unnamed protein product [Rotaria socialis]|uniref:Uncharacterized protein n=1 Tax=Rotaria socialis TaxID=392032 RepID=A0A821DG61_9BILA|nr:unnamed protein product [Rotaria socialis]CAF4621114.1 unnamed protein product [Rotaria socialis]